MSVKLVCAIWEFLGKGYVCLMCVLYLYYIFVPRLEMHFQSAECAFSEQGFFFYYSNNYFSCERTVEKQDLVSHFVLVQFYCSYILDCPLQFLLHLSNCAPSLDLS